MRTSRKPIKSVYHHTSSFLSFNKGSDLFSEGNACVDQWMHTSYLFVPPNCSGIYLLYSTFFQENHFLSFCLLPFYIIGKFILPGHCKK